MNISAMLGDKEHGNNWLVQTSIFVSIFLFCVMECDDIECYDCYVVRSLKEKQLR